MSLGSPKPYQVRRMKVQLLQDALDQLWVNDGPYDIVQVETAHLAGLRVPSPGAVVLDEHNVEYELFQRMCDGEPVSPRKLYYGLEALKLKRNERNAWSRADACAVTSDRELAIVLRYAPQTPAAVIPNAVDLDYFHPAPVDTRQDTIVFTGLMNYRPNVDAAAYFVRDILPRIQERRPQARFLGVGQGVADELQALESDTVHFTGWVDDIRPHLWDAAAVVVPLRMGSGTRLKVLDALACGKGIVATTLGVEGIDVQDGEHLLLADEPAAFADRVVRLLEHPSLATAVGARGRALVESRYCWATAARQLDDLHGAAVATQAVHSESLFRLPDRPRVGASGNTISSKHLPMDERPQTRRHR
jgi:glycosyltransferase involved in cell wall biosynthesis